MSKKIKRALIACAPSAAVAFSAAFSACNMQSNHPRAKITLSFNSVSYEIEYTLYRNMYPQTVRHFIELADAGFYDNMIVHNYNASSDWFTGAYGYNIAEGEEAVSYEDSYSNSSSEALKEYLSEDSKEQAYYALAANGALTPTVYKAVGENGKPEGALPTLIGEFSANDHVIENNALTTKTGALKMFYYEKENPYRKAAIITGSGQVLEHDYQYNCATSIFSMQVGTSTSYSADKYCVFGELRDDNARDKLSELLDDIADYLEDVGWSNSDFTTSVTTAVDEADSYAKPKNDATFTMTRMPLVIETVKITKH